MMSDDPPSTPRIVCVDTASPVATSERGRLGTARPDREKMSRKRAAPPDPQPYRARSASPDAGEAHPEEAMQVVIMSAAISHRRSWRAGQGKRLAECLCATATC